MSHREGDTIIVEMGMRVQTFGSSLLQRIHVAAVGCARTN